MPSDRNHNNDIMSFDSPHQQHSSECLTKRNSRQETVDSIFNLVSHESLMAMGFNDGDKSAYYSLTPNKSWNSLSGSCEEATVALTDCSSRTSLTDLDISYTDELKDPLPSPEPCYWKPLDEKDDLRKNRHPFLPSVLTRSPRAVSFSGIEEVHVYDEEVVEGGIQQPKTPAIEWYSSKGSAQNLVNLDTSCQS